MIGNDAVVIPCAGEGERWGDHLGVPKYLAPGLDHEPILHRSLRLLGHSLPQASFAVIGRPDAPRTPTPVPGMRARYAFWFGADDDGRPTVGKIASSRSSWSVRGRTIILWGDVWLSRWAAGRIARLDGDLLWFGRSGPSRFTGKPYGELWGLSFRRSMHSALEDACWSVGADVQSGKLNEPLAWYVMRRLHGGNYFGAGASNGPHFVTLDDWTEDFDYSHDYDRWLYRAQRAAIAGTFDTGVPPE